MVRFTMKPIRYLIYYLISYLSLCSLKGLIYLSYQGLKKLQLVRW